VVVVKVHVPACLHLALYRVPHRGGAVVQHLRDATRVTLGQPLFLGQVSGELGGVLEDEHKSYIGMCVKSCAMDGLPSIVLASSPHCGRARSRLSRMVLLRSQRWVTGHTNCGLETAGRPHNRQTDPPSAAPLSLHPRVLP
jgi:hypothetical protein